MKRAPTVFCPCCQFALIIDLSGGERVLVGAVRGWRENGSQWYRGGCR